MAIDQAKPFQEPGRWPLLLAALVALGAGAAQMAGQGWRAGVRVDAGEGMRVALETPAAGQDRREVLEEEGWEGAVEAGGVRVRLQLTLPANCDK
jgi:hypothetical protein